MNKLLVLGPARIAKAIETKQTGGGTTVAITALAFDTLKKGVEGYETEANFVDCVAYGRLAERLYKYTEKGVLLFVEGKLKQDRWQNAEGQKRSKVGVVLDNFEIMSKPKEQQQQQQQQGGGGIFGGEEGGGDGLFSGGPAPMSDDDIPF